MIANGLSNVNNPLMLTFFLFLRNDENEHKTRSRSNGTTHCWILSSLSTKQKKMGWPVKTSIAVLFFSIFFPLSHLSTHTQKLFPCSNFGRFASLQARLKNILDIKIEKSWCRRVLVNYTFSMMVQDGRSSVPKRLYLAGKSMKRQHRQRQRRRWQWRPE